MDHFLTRHEKIIRENEQLRIMNQNVTGENKQLRSDLHRMTISLEERTLAVGPSSSTKHKTTIDEEQFRMGLQPKEGRASSPVNTESLEHIHSKDTGFDSQESMKKQLSQKLLGEIAFQLDRRILFSVFQRHKSLYGYTVSSIPSKITEAITHPLTGEVNEDYRRLLNQKYENVKETLSGFGYKITHHPLFSEYIVNTYGILESRPKPGSSQEADFYNPLYLKSVIETTAPSHFQKDLKLLLECLKALAQKDEKPLFLWES